MGTHIETYAFSIVEFLHLASSPCFMSLMGFHKFYKSWSCIYFCASISAFSKQTTTYTVKPHWDSNLRHYGDVIMGAMASQITSLTIVYSTVYSDADERKHQSSASLAFVRRIHRGPVNSPHKWPVTRKMFPFDDVIMRYEFRVFILLLNLGLRHLSTVVVALSTNINAIWTI